MIDLTLVVVVLSLYGVTSLARDVWTAASAWRAPSVFDRVRAREHAATAAVYLAVSAVGALALRAAGLI